MPVLMMHIGYMGMDVLELIMLVPMCMRFAGRIVWSVHMLMMFVMTVRV